MIKSRSGTMNIRSNPDPQNVLTGVSKHDIIINVFILTRSYALEIEIIDDFSPNLVQFFSAIYSMGTSLLSKRNPLHLLPFGLGGGEGVPQNARFSAPRIIF